MSRLKLAPSARTGRSRARRVSAQACHQPCSPTTTRGSRLVVEPGAGAHAALRRLDRHPVAVAMPRACAASGCSSTSGSGARLRRLGSARCWRLAEQRRLRAGQDQREARRQVGPRHRADRRLLEIGQRRVAVVEEGLRIELDLARRRGEAARRAVRVRLGMFGVAGLQRQPHAAGRGAQLLQRDAGRARAGGGRRRRCRRSRTARRARAGRRGRR